MVKIKLPLVAVDAAPNRCPVAAITPDANPARSAPLFRALELDRRI